MPTRARDTGVVRMENRTSDGVEHFFAVTVPDGYDPARRYQVRIQLHGGVGGRATNAPVGNGTVGALTGAEQIYVVPYAWAEAPWWSPDQVLNLAAIVDRVKRLYNVDENRVVLSGVSDGATGALYVAMRETTPFASILPLNGYLMVLALRDIDDGLIFANNLRNKPLFAVNGGRDPLYPTRVVDPYIEHLKHGGVSIDYHPQPNAAHNTAWWPEVKDSYEAFVREHPRQPLPDTLTWEMGNSAAFNRAHWLVDRSARRAEERREGARGSQRHADAAVSRLRRAQHRHAHQPRGGGIECGADRAEGRRRAAAPERSQRRGGLRRRRRAVGRAARIEDRADGGARQPAGGARGRSTSRRSSRRRPSHCSRAAARRAASISSAPATSSPRRRAASPRSRCCCRRISSTSGSR